MRIFGLTIFDLDGTLYRGEVAIPGAVEAVQAICDRGGLVRYLTNNSTQTLEAFAAKLTRLGFPAGPEDVESSSSGTVAYLEANGISTVQALGESGLIESIRASGRQVAGPEDDWSTPAQAVVVGLHRQFTYAHVAKAMASVRGGARFIATNQDATLPMEEGRQVPGAGTLVAAVQTCTDQLPFVIGKPSPFLTDLVMEKAGIGPTDTLVVGDRMDTDIASGKAAGCHTLLVLTGATAVAPPGQLSFPDLTGLFDS